MKEAEQLDCKYSSVTIKQLTGYFQEAIQVRLLNCHLYTPESSRFVASMMRETI